MKKLLKWIWYHRPSFLPLPWRGTNGAWMLLYPDDEGWAYTHSYEKGIVDWLRTRIRPGMFCVDVGAGQGFYSTLLSKLVAPDGKVFAFEPVTQSIERLNVNLWLNSVSDQVQIVECAVGASVGAFVLHLPQGHESRSSLKDLAKEVEGKVWEVPVRATTLDSFFDINQIVHLIKIDAEGAELEVLEGGKNWIEKWKPLVILEVADVTTKQFGYRAQVLIDWMEELGYRICASDKGNRPVNGEYRDTFAWEKVDATRYA